MQSKITTEKLAKWHAEKNVLYACDIEAKKELSCTLSDEYRVLHKGVLVLETMDRYKAVEKYNSIESEEK
jgi:hypothetical protein